MPGVWDPLSALLAESAGFDTVFLSGFALAGTLLGEPDIGIIDARITWYVAISSIVIGHVISVWLAHRVALREYGTPRRAVIASIPLTLLMIAYTAISLSVIAEPLVQFREADGVEVSAPVR